MSTGWNMLRLGSVVSRNRQGGYACELLDDRGHVIGYAIFSSVGSHIGDCQTVKEADRSLVAPTLNPPSAV